MSRGLARRKGRKGGKGGSRRVKKWRLLIKSVKPQRGERTYRLKPLRRPFYPRICLEGRLFLATYLYVYLSSHSINSLVTFLARILISDFLCCTNWKKNERIINFEHLSSLIKGIIYSKILGWIFKGRINEILPVIIIRLPYLARQLISK